MYYLYTIPYNSVAHFETFFIPLKNPLHINPVMYRPKPLTKLYKPTAEYIYNFSVFTKCLGSGKSSFIFLYEKFKANMEKNASFLKAFFLQKLTENRVWQNKRIYREHFRVLRKSPIRSCVDL